VGGQCPGAPAARGPQKIREGKGGREERRKERRKDKRRERKRKEKKEQGK